MSQATTEGLHPEAIGLDGRPLLDIASILLSGQQAALAAVAPASVAIAAAAELMADAIRNGGRLVYVAAGSSGLMALADGAELEGTFGIPSDRICLHMAGGVPTAAHMPGETEDDVSAAVEAAGDLQAHDVVIALSASGSTPYPLAFLKLAGERGVRRIAIANNPGAAMFDEAEIAVLLQTPPEVIAGSTRMGAGSAQKVALNMMSTLMGVSLGHVHDGMMVNVQAENTKLRARAAGMVAQISGVDVEQAAHCLDRTDGEVKPAVLLAAGAETLDLANEMLKKSNGHLRAALAQI